MHFWQETWVEDMALDTLPELKEYIQEELKLNMLNDASNMGYVLKGEPTITWYDMYKHEDQIAYGYDITLGRPAVRWRVKAEWDSTN